VQFNSVNPYPGYGPIYLYSNSANSHYNSLQASVNSRLRSDLTFQLAYTYSKAIDCSAGRSGTGSGGDLQGLPDPYDRSYGCGPSWFNRGQIFNANFVYDIPAFRHASSRALRTGLGGWQFSGYITAMSGLPLNITLGGSQGNNGLPNPGSNQGPTNRPNVNGAASYPQTVNEWFNTSIFSTPAVGQWGNLGSDALWGPGRANVNFSLFKSFVLSEKRGSSLQLRAESFNIFNHTQFTAVSTSFSASNFGQVTAAGDPRVFQLGLKAFF
jgi:hypothetical protein